MTYDIRDVNALESTVSDLATTCQSVVKNGESLQYILNQITTNWQNDEGQDIQSIVAELQGCIANLNNAIAPTVSKYISTMNTLVAESRATLNRTI